MAGSPPPLLGTVLTLAIGHVQHRRRAAHQCRSCRQLWALCLKPGADVWLIFCRYCGAPRAAQPPRKRSWKLDYSTATRHGIRDFASVNQVVATKCEVLVEHTQAARARELPAVMPREATI